MSCNRITWYEALAFARWLEKLWRVQGLLSAQGKVVLPSEPEWEKAARGGRQIPDAIIMRSPAEGFHVKDVALRENENPQRLYPWGDKPESDCANYNDTGIRKTSAVGCFAGGASPYGCEEMSGNVWEWTRSLLGDYAYPVGEKKRAARENFSASADTPRVLRGGAPILLTLWTPMF